MRTAFINGEIYHIYNRGVDRRDVFKDTHDLDRFLESMSVFNTTEPVGGVFLSRKDKKHKRKVGKPLVELLCYCLNQNHFHLMLRQLAEGGVSEFTRRLGGYTKYFNEKYHRSGVLFQGPCKSKHVASNEYLLYLSVYVNLNNRVHRVGHSMSNSSWNEYVHGASKLCNTKLILGQFKNPKEYEEFALDTLKPMIEKKDMAKDLSDLLIE
ncbi:MAG: hypothetical protein HY470_01450 [Candidatus Ryanbacteria bacterium]|nr:hypothetical protein [Candidatus Ryanbacteria bacterium]